MKQLSQIYISLTFVNASLNNLLFILFYELNENDAIKNKYSKAV